MAKQFYTAEEAQAKLGMGDKELKQLIRDGQLREFRDGSEIRYKVEEVDGLAENLATLSGSLSGTSGELVLEPADETSMGLTGSDMLTLEEADRTSADSTVVDDKKEDTVITSVGISVFDDEEVPEADPGAKTVMSEQEKTSGSGLAIDSAGSSGTGSGLLDLSRESDDTSLGAELLDEIYTEDQEAGLPEMGEATRAGLEAAAPEEQPETQAVAEQQDESEAPAVAAAPAAPRVGGPNPVDWGLNGVLVATLVPVLVTAVAVSANLQGVVPRALQSMYESLPIYGGILAGIAVVGFFVGYLLGRRQS